MTDRRAGHVACARCRALRRSWLRRKSFPSISVASVGDACDSRRPSPRLGRSQAGAVTIAAVAA
jgi:hypothetical protein